MTQKSKKMPHVLSHRDHYSPRNKQIRFNRTKRTHCSYLFFYLVCQLYVKLQKYIQSGSVVPIGLSVNLVQGFNWFHWFKFSIGSIVLISVGVEMKKGLNQFKGQIGSMVQLVQVFNWFNWFKLSIDSRVQLVQGFISVQGLN